MTSKTPTRLPAAVDVCFDEILITDDRQHIRPSEMVERRLRDVLGHHPLFHSFVPEWNYGRRPLAQEGGPNRVDLAPTSSEHAEAGDQE